MSNAHGDLNPATHLVYNSLAVAGADPFVRIWRVGRLESQLAAADPPDEPPATRSGSCGFFTTPQAEFSVDEPMANSSMLVLPIRMAS